MIKTQTYTKINTLYRRYKNLGKVELPNKNWIKFQNKIIIGEFSDDYMDYIKDLEFDCFSKIDGTNSKIVYLPSIQENVSVEARQTTPTLSVMARKPCLTRLLRELSLS